VTLYERNGHILLRWRQDGKDAYDTVKAGEYENVMAEALTRAGEINAELAHRRRSRRSYRRTTVKKACELFLKSKEATPDCSGPTIRKYRQEMGRIIEFAGTRPGRRCAHLHEIDTEWCQDFVSWLDSVRTTGNGGPVTEKNPERFLSGYQKLQTRQRLSSMIETCMARTPPLVPHDFRNPMTRDLIGRRPRKPNRPSEPPVTVDELVAVIPVLDEYALALLAPLFYYGPRPSELGHVLPLDLVIEDGMLKIVSRPSTGYWTKGKVDKFLPVTAPLAACLRPFRARPGGPLFIKRWVYERKAKPMLDGADESGLAQRFDDLKAGLAPEPGEFPKKEEIEKASERVWSEAGAVHARDVSRELRRAAKRAGLARMPNPLAVRHLFETTCEEARLSPGVIRHLMGHGPLRGDSLFKYNSTSIRTLHEQVSILDERRKPLLDALVRRASELGRHRSL